ncbi:MAG TPA: TRAP transporter large permease [Ramlibacter sp.]|uniref:TRAP transporter large permease n=1 Tax=Ramlibacter sp. TaxID=1917967 RepID=UPI002CFC6C1D|nr:TRAP transporter large permease [Ramlibacter sp.]HVZ42800.1 TRAP transporter large permease [Ramlibacter sp.]
MAVMLVLFAAVLALVLIDVPIAVSLGLVAVAAMLATHGTASLPNMAVVIYNGATNFPLLAIPLFILAGAIMNASGISRRLIAFASALFGWLRGGLAHVSIGASLFFAEISGSAVADVAALGSLLIPGMKEKGYPSDFAAASMSSAATLAVIIPPSIPMILYAVMAETSVVQLFVAGIVPGLIGAAGLMGTATFLARRYDLPRAEAFSLRKVMKTGREALWAFLLPIIILGGIFGGIVTATEGAALAVGAALFVGVAIYRELDLKHLRAAAMEGGVQTAVVMLLVATSALLGTYLSEVRAPQALAQAVSDFTSNKWAVLALLNVLFLFLGMFLHSAAAIILVVPIVMPLVRAAGIDPVHFGLIVTINLGIGQQTPPVASVLMVASSIAKASVWQVTRVNVWYIGVLVAVLALVTYVPITGMGLVQLFYR